VFVPPTSKRLEARYKSFSHVSRNAYASSFLRNKCFSKFTLLNQRRVGEATTRTQSIAALSCECRVDPMSAAWLLRLSTIQRRAWQQSILSRTTSQSDPHPRRLLQENGHRGLISKDCRIVKHQRNIMRICSISTIHARLLVLVILAIMLLAMLCSQQRYTPCHNSSQHREPPSNFQP
jgi:hypothetical protein